MENNNYLRSDILLEEIFTLTQDLYKEMSKKDEDVTNDHAAIFILLTELAKKLINADRASFWKWEKRKKQLWTMAAVGEQKIVIPEGTGIVGKAIANGATIVENDPYSNPDFNSDVDKKTGYVTKSILVMPVSNCKGEFIGAYQAINKIDSETGFDPVEDVKRLSLAAFICGIVLESETFLDDAHHDKLTDVKNRMGFYHDYEKTYRSLITNSPVSMYICDIDFFKKVNDTYGHNAGDAVLKHVADLFKCSTRACDGIYRWGGEEFIAIMPNTELEEAAMAAERMRSNVEASVCKFEDLEIKVTMSFGVSQLSPVKSIEENIKAADEKLYEAKSTGRNRVIK